MAAVMTQRLTWVRFTSSRSFKKDQKTKGLFDLKPGFEVQPMQGSMSNRVATAQVGVQPPIVRVARRLATARTLGRNQGV
jgi:hypothetical protein